MTGNIVLPIHLGASKEALIPEKNEYRGAEAIGKAFGASRQAVVRWEKMGAPIVKIGGKYQCEYKEMWEWLKANKKRLYEKLEKG